METGVSYEAKANGHVNLADNLNSILVDLARLANEAQAQAVPTAKRQFLAGLEINETLREMDKIVHELHAKLTQRVMVDASLSGHKRQIEEIKALHIVNGEVEGKNEKEREARLLVILNEDLEYQEARERLDAAEAEVAQLGADVEFMRSKDTALRYRARLIAAQLEFLAE